MTTYQERARGLLEAQTPGERAAIARRAGEAMWTHKSSGDLRAAEALARELCQDAVEMVRQSLAEAVIDVPYLPHDIAQALARDVDRVAETFLTQTPALDDGELSELVKVVGEAACTAIASRRRVSRTLCRTIVKRAPEPSVEALAGNAGADIGPEEARGICRRFAGSEGVLATLAGRGDLSADVLDELMSRISEQMLARLYDAHETAGDAPRLRAELELRTQIQLIGILHRVYIRHHARTLFKRGMLSDALLIRAARCGYERFVEIGLALRAEIPEGNAQKLLRYGGHEGTERLLEKAGIQPSFRADLCHLVEELSWQNA